MFRPVYRPLFIVSSNRRHSTQPKHKPCHKNNPVTPSCNPSITSCTMFAIWLFLAMYRRKIAALGNNFPKDCICTAVKQGEAIEGCSESNVCTTAGDLSVQTDTRQKTQARSTCSSNGGTPHWRRNPQSHVLRENILWPCTLTLTFHH